MPWRLLLYQVEIWRQVMRDTPQKERERPGFKLPVIVPMVLYNGSDPWTAPLSFRGMLAGEDLFEDEALVSFSYFLLDVQRYTPEDLERLANVIGAVFLIDQHTHLKIDEWMALFRRLAPTIDNLSEEQREQFAIWFEHVLRRLAKTKSKEQEIKQVITDIHKKGMSAVISNLEKNLEWIEEQGMEKGVKTVAINLLRKGMTASFIAEVTGLPENKIEQWKQEFREFIQ